jgi:hypothetical protein
MLKKFLAGALFALLALAFAVPASALSLDQKRVPQARNCVDGQALCYYQVTINFNDTNISTGQNFGALPKNAYILSIDSDVTTAFNAATTNVLTIGATQANANEIVADGASATANISNSTTTIATGIRHLTTAVGLALAVTGSSTYQTALNGAVPLYAKYTQTGTAATTGSVTIVICYTMANDL